MRSEEVKPGKENHAVVIENSSNDVSDDEDVEWDTVDLHPLSEDVTETPDITCNTRSHSYQYSAKISVRPPSSSKVEFLGRNASLQLPAMQSSDKSVLKPIKCTSSPS